MVYFAAHRLNPVRKFNTNFHAYCAVGTVSLFVLFLIASAPHRVHHLLENLPLREGLAAQAHHHDDEEHRGTLTTRNQLAAHHGDHAEQGSQPLHTNRADRDARHDNSTQTDCVVQTVTQHSQLAPVQSLGMIFVGIECAAYQLPAFEHVLHFSSAPFSQRAPSRI
jgi:hypothetical protein